MTDLDIARAARLKPLEDVAAKIGIPREAIEPFGRHRAKLDVGLVPAEDRPQGKLILVTAISPTLAGEGKSTTSVGLTDALSLIGRKTVLCLREPSLGPCFGMKGGATGGGYAQVVPMEEINLHFTGDFHAITAAHNLLAAMIDNHIYWGNALGIDVRRIVWRRVMDANDRALRSIVQSLGGAPNGFPRESGFDITAASEVMAILCLASDLDDLELRLSRIVVAYTRDRRPVTAGDLSADGAMAVLLKDAIRPNLVQTLEGNPVLVHGGPFANIAHGCNSVIATRTALAHADYVVTEAGFGADLGAEKFFDIKCRQSGCRPMPRCWSRRCARSSSTAGSTRMPRRRRCRGGPARRGQPCPPHRESPPVRGSGGRRDQPFRDRQRGRDRPGPRDIEAARVGGLSCAATGPRGRGRGRPGARRCGAERQGQAQFATLYDDDLAAVREDQHDRDAHLPRRGGRRRPERARAIARVGESRAGPFADLHGQDPV